MYGPIKNFLEKNKNKNFNFIVEKHNNDLVFLLKKFKNVNLIFIEELKKVSFEKIIEYGEFLLKSKYFSIGDLIYGSYLKNQKEILENIPNAISLNNYSKNIPSFTITGKKIQIYEKDNSIEIVNKQQIGNLYKKSNNYKIFLLAKILTSSFFLNEITEFFPDVFLKNYFFKNLQEFKDVSKYLNLNINLSSFDNFSLAIKFAIDFLNITPDEYFPDFIDERTGFFYEKVIFYDNNQINCEYYYQMEFKVKNHKIPYLRNIEVNSLNYELFNNPYDFYMLEILKLKKPGLSKQILLAYHESNDSFLAKNGIIKIPLIGSFSPLYYSVSNDESIKKKARALGLKNIYIYNLKTREVNEYDLRQSKKQPEKIIISY